MARLSGRWRLAAAVALMTLGTLGTFGSSPSSASELPPPPGAEVGTPLPPGWELCILQGVGATVTPDNVIDLDEWQVAEGGSTDNSAAYDPFNTRRMTDVNNSPLPAATSANGFPAFAAWSAGCAATVATLLQPNMAPIVTALRAADVSPPGLFLVDVDQSQWCAPENGVPCYLSEILASSGVVVQPPSVQGAAPGAASGSGSSGSGAASGSATLDDALTIFSEASAALTSYEQTGSLVASDQQILAAQTQQLATAEAQVAAAKSSLSTARRVLRRLALYTYTNDDSSSSGANLGVFGAPSEQQLLQGYFRNIDAAAVIERDKHAQDEVAASESQRLAASAAVTQDTLVLASADAAENQALVRVENDMKTIEAAAACTTAPSTTTTAAAGSNSQAPNATQTGASSPADSATPAATAKSQAPAIAPPSPTTTTSTTSPPAGSSATQEAASTAGAVPAAGTATPSSTTGTTPTPGAGGPGGAAASTPSSGGGASSTAAAAPAATGQQVVALQVCVAALAPLQGR